MIALIERRLAQVEPMILRRISELAERIKDGCLNVADMADIEAEAVLRVFRNPEGIYSEQDGSYGYQLNREAADDTLRILTEEREMLGVRPTKMFAIVPAVPSLR